jgi:hypothetical protein
LGSAALDVQPQVSPKLHAQIMTRIEASKRAPNARLAERRLSSGWSRARSPFLHKIGLHNIGANAGQVIAAAASIVLLCAAMVLWRDSATSLPDGQGMVVASNPVNPIGQHAIADSTAKETALSHDPAIVPSSRPSRGHEDLSAALNYFLTLGQAPAESANVNQPRVIATASAEAPWLRPTVSQDVLAFEIDQQRLEQLANALFAMQ